MGSSLVVNSASVIPTTPDMMPNENKTEPRRVPIPNPLQPAKIKNNEMLESCSMIHSASPTILYVRNFVLVKLPDVDFDIFDVPIS